ncbi:YceD family protein [Desulforamulus hydrothermalis]|uniref:DUF177 domain-containing protein n=1 Tax=Desulforamulus hydrothermalis Lam5 = DSM 18033 TaxID=1121428 RepID=K8DZI7_9FIRM|nr:DUF177 domain-containing protein [Desulforamulus hydrothermalis]CCO08504.1 conserved hypothetical protein [Desulforamulus hydrothermalis Lam5 = DSM 18033]SHH29784.1 uncharacterized protein SAMN02745177_02127 [Desulforamulus hydrothermalis Lam5 = DSM 18033]
MKINILKLKNAPGERLTFNFSKELAALELGGQVFRFVAPVSASGEVVNRRQLFHVKGETRATVRTGCTYCLEPFELSLHGRLDEVYARDGELSGSDAEIIGFDGDIINVEPEVIKSLVLEIPMRLACSPDCRGLCQRCGANLNVQTCDCQVEEIDPRLAILKNYINKF